MRPQSIVSAITAAVALMLLSVSPSVAEVVDGGYRIFRPDGPGPHPAVVFLSGCSGFTPAHAPRAYERPAEQLRSLGFVIVWADFLGRRNLKSCMSGISQQDAGRDAVAAASWLRSQSYIDAKRITVMGWSYGGGGVLSALGAYRSEDEFVFTRAVVYYPYCAVVTPWSLRIPVLVLRGGADDVAPLELCKSVLEVSSKTGDVTVIDYPEARHAFDLSELPPKMQYGFGTLGYHPTAAAAAWQEVLRFLQATK